MKNKPFTQRSRSKNEGVGVCVGGDIFKTKISTKSKFQLFTIFGVEVETNLYLRLKTIRFLMIWHNFELFDSENLKCRRSKVRRSGFVRSVVGILSEILYMDTWTGIRVKNPLLEDNSERSGFKKFENDDHGPNQSILDRSRAGPGRPCVWPYELFPVINLFLSYFGHSLSFLKRANLVASGFLSRTRNTEFHQEWN